MGISKNYVKIELVEVDFVVFICVVLPLPGVSGEVWREGEDHVYFLDTSRRSSIPYLCCLYTDIA